MRCRMLSCVRSSFAVLLVCVCVYAVLKAKLNAKLTKEDNEKQELLAHKFRVVSVKGRSVPPGQLVCQRPRLDEGNWRELPARSPDRRDTVYCGIGSDWVEVTGYVARIKRAAHTALGRIDCNFTAILCPDDMTSHDGSTTHTSDEYVFLESDFARVRCRAANGDEWSSFLAGVRLNHTVREAAGWNNLPPSAFHLNVLILGFHSLSRIMFTYTMPKTSAYLLDTLGAQVMEGYNVVGEGKRAALIPLLTGRAEKELPDATRSRVKDDDPVTVDRLPFIWKKFKTAGYVTAFMEDMVNRSAFTRGKDGFKDQPTDYYTRPFYLAASKNYSDYQEFCLGQIPRHQVMLNNIRNFYNSYREVPKFVFGFLEELNANRAAQRRMGLADADMVEWLKTMKADGHLENTLLVFVSDHGQWFPDHLLFLRGKLDSRLPFLSLAFPSWFKVGHHHELRNLETNAHRLTTPYDLYATLEAMLDFTGPARAAVTERGISLLREVPLERSCEHAFIPLRWCTCLVWSEVALGENTVVRAAATLIAEINRQMLPHRNTCATQHMKRVLWARLLTPNPELRRYNITSHDGSVGKVSTKPASEVFYRLMVTTTPGITIYEAFLKYDVVKADMSVKVSDIVRVNVPRPSELRCSFSGPEEIKKFCVCTEFMNKAFKNNSSAFVTERK